MLYFCMTKKLPIERRLLDDALAFASERLKLEDDVCVVLKFSKTCSAAGYAEWDDNEEEFVIELNSRLTDTEIVRTIFHELVHIRQLQEETYDPDTQSWKGQDCSHLEYEFYPWEIEAFRLEEEMMLEFGDRL